MERHDLHFMTPRYGRLFRALSKYNKERFISNLRQGLHRGLAVYRRKPAVQLLGTNRKRGKRKYIGFQKNKSLSVIYIPSKHHVKAI